MQVHICVKLDADAFIAEEWLMAEKSPSDTVIRAWARLVRAETAVLAAVEADLKTGGFPPLAWYDVLLELSRRKEGLRPFEIEKETLLAQYNLSRLLDRLEKAGYVERQPSPDDGRGNVVVLTEDGRALMKRMWPTYRAAIARHVGEKLSENEAAQLAALLGKLIGSR
jgi:DNA-binding MarR family transcriptional regulator